MAGVGEALPFSDGSLGAALAVLTLCFVANYMVRSLWQTVRGIANAGLALVTLRAGFNLMGSEHIGAPYHGDDARDHRRDRKHDGQPKVHVCAS